MPTGAASPGMTTCTGSHEEAVLERKWWTLIACRMAIFMLLLDITVVNVALPDIQRSLHSSFSDLQWVVDAYSLTLAAFLLTAGVARPTCSGAGGLRRRTDRLHGRLRRLRALHHAADAQPLPRPCRAWAAR